MQREAEERLSLVERQVAAQRAALASIPLNMPVPGRVTALLAAPLPVVLDGTALPPSCLPRLTALMEQIQAMLDDLALRERGLAGRLATMRAARRSGPAAHLVDYRT